MNHYISVLKKYAVFSGRAQRSEYWYFVLFNFIISFVLSIVAEILTNETTSLIVSVLYSLAVLIPSIAVSVRRLHDVGKSGWWILIGLVPIIGGIWLLVLAITDSSPETNIYGPNPKILV